MKIALFTETYIGSINGVMAHIKTLRDGLEKLGHEVLVVTADKHCKHHYIENNVLHCPAIESKRLYGFGVAFPLSHKRQRLIADFGPDVMHIHQEFGIGISGILAARAMRRPLVYTLHTMYDQYIYYIAPKMLLRAATSISHRYERFIARNAHALTSPSQKGDEYFKKIGVNKEFNLIPNSIDLDAFNPGRITTEQRDGLRKKYGIAPEKTIACFVGRLGQEKSVDVVLDYWASTIKPQDNLHFLIVGDGPDRENLEKRARDNGIANMVTFAGMVPHENMPVYFATCDIYVTASLSEMNSISMLEGMASGLPTLQRYDELNADQIKAGVNGYLYNTAGEMAEKLKEIAALSPEELAVTKQTVIDTVTDRGGKELAAYMLGIYEKAIAEKSAEGRNSRAAV
ncbi:MAG: glycosyltransferase [Oscillospiraceae bacterium]|jgi:1,2-diacylglycerol 3-alpha-glucosyltransferase|nr:glycosyltransferase [Oscillospiraceae bacterium]